jgi:hypothetical protein
MRDRADFWNCAQIGYEFELMRGIGVGRADQKA